MKKYDIKEMMIDNLATAIAFSIVWIIAQGIFVLLGAKDYTLPALLLECAVMVVTLWLVLTATFMLLMLFENIRGKIKAWKIKRRFEKCMSKGERLDKHAENLGLHREPEETDDELRNRCMLTMLEMDFRELLKRL